MTDGGTPEGRAMGPSLPVDAHVEVRSEFDGSWQGGFIVEEVTEVGYRLRRESDGTVLPELPHERVRRRRTRSTWWV
ncbi:MAG: hypothetical protein M3Z03_10315 [Actinomycetota bacterium]|nr:hypothetical protein [Actinomycetota bacterium]